MRNSNLITFYAAEAHFDSFSQTALATMTRNTIFSEIPESTKSVLISEKCVVKRFQKEMQAP